MITTEKKACRLCGGQFRTVLDLGNIYPSEFVSELPSMQPRPLLLVQCVNCQLVQLKNTINPELTYRQYWYRSSLNQSMVSALKDVVLGIEKRVPITAADVVIDIGANDGTLLNLYSGNPKKVGFDPAKNLAEQAKKSCFCFINDFFSAADYPLKEKAKAVTSIAMFYDLDDPHQFTADIAKVLAKNGVWVIQMTDLMSMLKANAFDNICMEHLEYYSLAVLSNLIAEHGLQIFDLEFNGVNGGSARTYISHKGEYEVSSTVINALAAERDYLNSFSDAFLAFNDRVQSIKETVKPFLVREKNNGKSIYVLGASTKGNTLLQYLQLDDSIIQYAAEINPEKFGLRTVGTDIPIISEDEALENNPDYFLVLPWHFINSFITRNQSYLERGGKFLVPMPRPAVIDLTGWNYL